MIVVSQTTNDCEVMDFLMHIWIQSLKAKIVESKPVACAVTP